LYRFGYNSYLRWFFNLQYMFKKVKLVSIVPRMRDRNGALPDFIGKAGV
jgi:hypothetical protein